MATNPAVPYWDEADTVTCHAGAAITGKRFVGISGPRTGDNPTVTHAAAAAAAASRVGVAAYDAAAGAKVTVYFGHQVMPVTTGAILSAGASVGSDAAGLAVAAGANPVLGTAYDDAASGADCPVKLAR